MFITPSASDDPGILARVIASLRSRKLPPWEELTYFQTPVVTSIAVSPGQFKQIVSGDVNRVAIAFSAQGQSYVVPQIEVNGFIGFGLNANTPVLTFLAADWPGLVQMPWYSNSLGGTGSGVLTCVTLALREWPWS